MIASARAALLCVLALVPPVGAEDLADAVNGYIAFEPYLSGIILPEQITADLWDGVQFVDTRDAAQFAAGTIPGAIHMEWREVPARLEELPRDRKVVLFCNTGSLSAQAAFAARLLGADNVVVLQTGYEGWQARAGYRP
jgi:rhodanese-related sulfurtransferase